VNATSPRYAGITIDVSRPPAGISTSPDPARWPGEHPAAASTKPPATPT